MGEYKFQTTVAKAIKDFLITALAVASASAGAALGEYFQNRENIEAAINVLPSPLVAVLVPLISAGAVALANWAKHRKARPVVAPLILLALLPSLASAQEPKDAPEYAIRTGSVTTATRGETDTRFSARLSLSIWTDKPGEHQQRDGIFPRVTLTGSQDGGSLALQNPEEFRSIVPEVEFRKTIRGALQAAGFASLTFSAEGDVDKPINARMFEGCGGLRGALQDDSSLFVGGCFSGPVGGTLALAVRGAKPVGSGEAWFSFVLPLRETALREKAWVLQAGTTYVVARGDLK